MRRLRRAGLVLGAAVVLVVTLLARVVEAPGPAPSTMPKEVRIGVLYPLSGRLLDWGEEAQPFLRLAEADANALPEAVAAGTRFRLVVRSDGTAPDAASVAARSLLDEDVRVIVGLPVTQLLGAALEGTVDRRSLIVSSASTGPLPASRPPGALFRVAPSELSLAGALGRTALALGYRHAVVVHRTDAWGDAYAERAAAEFRAAGGEARLVPFTPTHPTVGDYAANVAAVSEQVRALGDPAATAVLLVAWEGEDLNILHHAAADPVLSRARWLAAVLYPSLLDGCYPSACFREVPAFALSRGLWGQEVRAPSSGTFKRVWVRAREELGHDPRFEHVYLYDAVQLAARAILAAGSDEPEAVAARLPAIAERYDAASGRVRFDASGDAMATDLAYYGLFAEGGGFVFRHYAYADTVSGQLTLLDRPAPRPVRFCPEC